ncbi:TPA: hypothetical protein JI054_02430 [Acinetobacter baumannii]|uniref:Uncharacterized protein n=9 Tax=Acinetobacter TaxID=469 RepID=A0A7H2NWC5_9GAMM|nr:MULTISPECIES: hypothetical protein [Acinetobacter]AGQ08400.1 hypothetical protein BJAB0715_03754 [Acinetobacter baumannii BJAB0715]AKQ28961.1 hypothetical protein ACX61_00635 [Acinetobacter baumannii]AMN03279.1 hypothetical protein AZE33_19440 [Acinetobacter baumannii]APO57436.1 hypothetical protein BBX32_02030 [Acinetobacter baumannii]ARG39680.1 hypothetical protein B7L35_12910 [Acinetobacter baumannii]
MNMIEILQSKRSQFYLLDINSLIILALAFCGVIISSTVYAKDIFNVELKCKGNDQEYCDIVKNSDNKTTFILRNMRYPEVDKVNENIFHAYGSCGSPCQYHFFISKIQEDQTKEFIALDKKNNCLIESDSKKNIIYARKLFNKNKKIIANLKNKEFNNVPIDSAIYNSFQEKSYFDDKGQLHLVAMLADVDKNGNSLYFNKIIKKTCE